MKNSEGYTGKIFESEVLPSLSDSWKDEGYFDEERSFECVRNHQEWNPSDPNNKVANELHYKVAEKLGLDDVNELKFYSALHSPLDKYFGIDAFFEINGALFTLDLSINPHKDVAKADIVVTEKDLHDEKELDNLSQTIARYLQKRSGQPQPLKKAA